ADPELTGLAKDCLEADADRRPRDAGVVAGRVAAYLAGVQRRLREAELERAGAAARARAERRARRLAAGLAALALLVTTAAAAAALWRAREGADTEKAVGAALEEATLLQGEGRWAEGRAVAERAEGRLGGDGHAALRQRVARLRADLDLVARLEEVRLRQSGVRDGAFDTSGADGEYERAFRDCDLDLLAPDPDLARTTDYLRAAAVREAALAAL